MGKFSGPLYFILIGFHSKEMILGAAVFEKSVKICQLML